MQDYTIGYEYQFIASFCLFVIAISMRMLSARLVWRKKESLTHSDRKLLGVVRNLAILVVLLGLLFIWAPILANFALSITAFAVAIVIATKELILCLSGAVWRGVTQPFDVGDWVEIGHERGEVLALKIMSTHLAELDELGGRFTGRTLVIPNSQLLSNITRSENLWRRYSHHKFTLIADYNVDIIAIETVLTGKVKEHCAEFQEVAERYMAAIRAKVGIDLLPAEPHVDIGTTIEGRPQLEVHLFCPVEKTAELQQQISLDFFKLTRNYYGTAPIEVAA